MLKKVEKKRKYSSIEIGMMMGLIFGSAFGVSMFLITINVLYFTFCGFGLIIGLIFGMLFQKRKEK